MIWLSISLRNKEKVVLHGCVLYWSGSLPGDDMLLLRHFDPSLDIGPRHGARVIVTGNFIAQN